MDETPEAIAEKTIELAESFKSITNVVILNIILDRDKLAGTGSKVNSIVQNFCKEDKTIKFMRQKFLDSKKHIGKDGIHLNNFGVTQIANIFLEFLNNG